MKKDNRKEVVRINTFIKASEVRLIGAEGEQLGVVKTDAALDIARQSGLDLVEIAPNATPPVCKVLDFGKYKYDQTRREREIRKRQHNVQVKGVRLTPNINDHDLQTKAKKARQFIIEGNRLKVSVFFHGRMIARKELGQQALAKFINLLEDIAELEHPPKMEGPKNMVVSMVPSKKQPKKAAKKEE